MLKGIIRFIRDKLVLVCVLRLVLCLLGNLFFIDVKIIGNGKWG